MVAYGQVVFPVFAFCNTVLVQWNIYSTVVQIANTGKRRIVKHTNAVQSDLWLTVVGPRTAVNILLLAH